MQGNKSATRGGEGRGKNGDGMDLGSGSSSMSKKDQHEARIYERPSCLFLALMF